MRRLRCEPGEEVVDDSHAVETGGLGGAGFADRVESERSADDVHMHRILVAPDVNTTTVQ